MKSNVKILFLKKIEEDATYIIRLYTVDSRATLESLFSLKYL